MHFAEIVLLHENRQTDLLTVLLLPPTTTGAEAEVEGQGYNPPLEPFPAASQGAP